MINESINLEPLAHAALMMWLLAVGLASFTFMLGIATGKKGLTMAVGAIFAFYNFFLASLAPAVSELAEAHKYTTLFYYYNTPKLITNDSDWWNALILAIISLAFLCIGLLFYRRRNIAG